MSERYLEKNFLWLLALSLVLHLAVYQLASLIPQEKEKPKEEATMVDLTDLPLPQPEPKKVLPEQKTESAPKPVVTREVPKGHNAPAPPPQMERRVAKESVPPLARQSERVAPLPRVATPGRGSEPAPQVPAPAPRKAEEAPVTRGAEPMPRGEGIFKPKGAEGSRRPQLFPSANTLARLEEKYRKRYADEIDDGETKFMNTDDIRFGSFLRRLETAIYGVWRYPHEALVRGIEGTTPVRITFNRKGEIVHVELLESSGSEILDNEVMRTLKAIGPVGSFPKGYTSDSFKLIAFFHYGGGGGRLH